MTTLTVSGRATLPTTHFSSQKSLLNALLMAEFESHLDRQQNKAKRSPKEDFVNL